MTEKTVGFKLTEETMGENLTEETMTETLYNDKLEMEAVVLVTWTMIWCGWLILRADKKLAGYIWFCSAAFHSIGAAIWIDMVIASIRNTQSRRSIENNSLMLAMCLVSCLAVFTRYCLAE